MQKQEIMAGKGKANGILFHLKECREWAKFYNAWKDGVGKIKIKYHP